MSETVAVGRVHRPHGVRGEVYVERYGEDPGVLVKGREFLVNHDKLRPTLKVASLRAGPKGRWLVRFEGVEDRDQAEEIYGWELHIDKVDLPELPADSYYNFQVIGLEVRTKDNAVLGKIEEVLDTGANDVFVVRHKDREILIPVIGQVVTKLAIKEGFVEIDPIPGLIPEDD